MPCNRLADIREKRSQTGLMRLMPSAVMRTRQGVEVQAVTRPRASATSTSGGLASASLRMRRRQEAGVVDEESLQFLEGHVAVVVVRQVVPAQFADAEQAYQQVGLFDGKA